MFPRPFIVSLWFESTRSDYEALRIPPHRLVIEPLVAVAQEITVFQSPQYSIDVPIPPSTNEIKGRYVLDLKQELVRGWERFWNVGVWRRGAVVIRLEHGAANWAEVFNWTEYGGVWSSRNQIRKGTPSSAINYCDANAVGSSMTVSLSASNGIQWMDVWADSKICEALDGLAQANCRHFVREVEMGKFQREIVYDTASYRKLI